MKNYILAIGTFLFLISCGKSEKQNEDKITQDAIVADLKEPRVKEVETTIYDYKQDHEFSEELDKVLLSKVAADLKINYEDIQINLTSSIGYTNNITFFALSYIAERGKQLANNEESAKEDEEDLGDFLERIYLFVNKTNGKIIAKEIDKNLSYYSNEAGQPAQTYIFKNLIRLNETTNAIVLSTEFGTGSRISLWSEQKFTVITLVDNKIVKLLYEYPMRKTQGDSNGGGTFQMETLETTISVSNKKTNGFYDLNVAKTFSYEDEVEEDEEKGIKAKVEPVKFIKEVERIKYNGRIYSFKNDDKYRFLKDYN